MGWRLIMKYMISTNLKHFKQVLMPNPHQRNLNLYIYMYVYMYIHISPEAPYIPVYSRHRLPWKSHLRQTHKDVDSALKLNFESSHPKWKLEHFHAVQQKTNQFLDGTNFPLIDSKASGLCKLFFCLLKTHFHPMKLYKTCLFPGYHFHPRFPPGGNLYPTKKRSISDSVVQPSYKTFCAFKGRFQTWRSVGNRVETLTVRDFFFSSGG